MFGTPAARLGLRGLWDFTSLDPVNRAPGLPIRTSILNSTTPAIAAVNGEACLRHDLSGTAGSVWGLMLDGVTNERRIIRTAHDDMTVVWRGSVDSMSDSNRAGFFTFGSDGASQGWGLRAYLDTGDAAFQIVDSAFNSYLAYTSGAGIAAGQLVTVVLRKRGATLSVFTQGKRGDVTGGTGRCRNTVSGTFGCVLGAGTDHGWTARAMQGYTAMTAVFDAPLSDAMCVSLALTPRQLFAPIERRIWVSGAGAGGGASAALAATGDSGTLAASASSPATATLSASGASGSFAGTAATEVAVSAALTGTSGAFSAQASSPAVAQLAVTGASGIFVGSAFSEVTAAAAVSGGSGVFSASAGSGTSVSLAAAGGSGAFAADASAPAAAQLAAAGGEGAFAGSAFPLTQAQLAATGAAGAFSAAASTVATASLATTGASGAIDLSAWSPATAAASVSGSGGTFAGSASVAGSLVWPDPATVLAGVAYGPTGADYTGTLALLTAAQVWAYGTRGLTEQVDANVEQVRGQNLRGTGTEADPWGPA